MSNNEGDSEIFVIELGSTTSTRRLTEAPGYDNSPRFSPDGRRILFTSDRRGPTELFLMEANGDDQRTLIAKPEIPSDDFFEKEPCWEPGSMSE
jgi:TolB protein